MDINNHTGYPHLIFRTGMEGNKIAAALMVRITYKIAGARAIPDDEQYWPMKSAAWQTPYGLMAGDLVFKRGGIDLFVFGSARAPGKQPVQRMDVRVVLPGKLDHRIAVFGDRFWQNGFTGLKITEPVPFVEMPLGISNAYGGWDEWDKLRFPYANNPYGKGFIWQKENAAGKALPNIENPKKLIASWKDRPHPVGLGNCPMTEEKIRKATEFDAEGNLVKFDPIFYNAAFPEMILNEIKPGEAILVSGLTEKQHFSFTVPEAAISAELIFGERTEKRTLYIDQIGLEPDKNRAFITYRYAFNYHIKPNTKRILNIHNQ